MNSVNIIGTLKEVDKDDETIRYCLVKKPYELFSKKVEGDLIPLQNWNHEKYGDLFSLPENSLVGIKGRVENYSNKLIIVIESIMYLGNES